MTAYLKIENPGVAAPEAFTLLGASTKVNSGYIGQFGSGNKHGVSTLLRHKLSPTIFAGNLCLEFHTRSQAMDDKSFERICVKYSGKDKQGKQGKHRNYSDDLGYVLDYGAQDWTTPDMALREFVSNALDRCVEETGNFKAVEVEVVNENQVRAKSGCTRIFVPMTADIFRFYENLGKWFLHFSESELIDEEILPKNGRNINGGQTAVIYRRGVRVREISYSKLPSLFDYNLNNLKIDEARNLDEWSVQHSCGIALSNSKQASLAALFQSFANINGTKYWEHEFSEYSLGCGLENETQKKVWQDAFEGIHGESAALTTTPSSDIVQRKGYTPIVAPENFVAAAQKTKIRTPLSVLTADERGGREIEEATADVIAAVDWVWALAEKHGMTNGKSKPEVKTFRKIMSAGAMTLGFYRDNIVYINRDIADGRSQQLLVTALEEVAHHVTGATDNSRDFQDWCLNLCVHLAKALS